MNPIAPLPPLLAERVRAAYVSPALRTVLDAARHPLRLSVSLPDDEHCPELVAGLVRATQLTRGVVLESLLVGVHADLRVTLAVGDREVLARGKGLADQTLDEWLPAVLTSLLPPVDSGALLRQVAQDSTVLATLHRVTRHMLTTTDPDEAVQILLSGLTAGVGLGFNRAVFLRYLPDEGALVGHAAVGAASGEEASATWERIDAGSGDIDALVRGYDPAHTDSALRRLVRQIRIPLVDAGAEVKRALAGDDPLHLRFAELRDPGLAQLGTNGELVLVPVRAHRRLYGLVMVDDRWQPGLIAPVRIRQLQYFVDLTSLVWETLDLLNRQRELARHDPLTGALNRRELDSQLAQLLCQASATNRSVALLMIDLDGFKDVNDQRGHPEGDRILRGVVKGATKLLRQNDKLGRYGGDEFVAVLPDATRSVAVEVAERLRAWVAQRLGVTLTVGVAVAPVDGRDADTLVAAADRRLLHAKQQGRDRIGV